MNIENSLGMEDSDFNRVAEKPGRPGFEENQSTGSTALSCLIFF